MLFRDRAYLLDSVGNANFDVFPDGKRFIRADVDERSVAIVLNWFAERLVPIN